MAAEVFFKWNQVTMIYIQKGFITCSIPLGHLEELWYRYVLANLSLKSLYIRAVNKTI